MLGGLITAFRTLTIFPIPGRETIDHSTALPFFPVVGLALGLVLWIISLVNRLMPGGGWPMGVAALMVLAGVICTRSLHLDGLADLADALGGGWDRHRRLEIMKDPRLGVFGAVAIILTLLCKWLAFSRLVAADSISWVIFVFTVSRTMQVELAVKLPYARNEGGTASSLVQNATGFQRAVAFSLSLIVALAYGPAGLFLLVFAQTLTWLYGNWCRRHLGGITGDLLGAGNEIIEVVLLLLAAAPAAKIIAYTGWGWVFG